MSAPRTKLVMPTRAPTAKLTVGTLTGVGSAQLGDAFAKIIVYFLDLAVGKPMPEEIASAFGIIFSVLVGVGLGLMAGWYMPPSAADTPIEVPVKPAGDTQQ